MIVNVIVTIISSSISIVSETEEEYIQQHRALHLGIEQFEKGLKNCRSKEEAFNLPMLEHLDQEVEELGRRGEDE